LILSIKKFRIRELAEQAAINMARTCYEDKKIVVIVDVMAEGLDKNQDQATKERCAEVVGEIGLPTSKLLAATDALLRDTREEQNVRVKLCETLEALKWPNESSQAFAAEIGPERMLERAKANGLLVPMPRY